MGAELMVERIYILGFVTLERAGGFDITMERARGFDLVLRST
jgi:hypothetical protein